MSVSINGTNGLTFSDGTSQNTGATGFGFKNRIINGAMMIDQRNAGASVTATDNTQAVYVVDRWAYRVMASSKLSYQRSTVAPAGFTNSMLITSLSAYTVGTSEFFSIRQPIEGFNVADLGWGTANAQTVTISFWVRSSLTGTFGGSVWNNAENRSYVFSYTINAANTWEQKSVTIAGDTTGTWTTNNTNGLMLQLCVGAGSGYQNAPNSWISTVMIAPTGQVNLAGTNGATFYITGVQLEKGSTATSFDYRPYGTELALCQRYAQVFGRDNSYQGVGCTSSASNSTTISYYAIPLRTQMRTAPSISYSGNWRVDDLYSASHAVNNISANGISNNTMQASLDISVTSGLTSGRAYQLQTNNDTSARLILSAEL